MITIHYSGAQNILPVLSEPGKLEIPNLPSSAKDENGEEPEVQGEEPTLKDDGEPAVQGEDGSSTSFVFAADENQTDCSYTKDKKTAFCTVGDNDTVWRCDKNKDGKTCRCEALPTEAPADVPTDIKNALTKEQIRLIRGGEFLQGGETKGDDYNTTKTQITSRNAPGPVPIPYPINNTKTQITINKENSHTPPPCLDKGPIPQDCTLKPLIK